MNRFKPLNIGNLTASLPIIQGGMGVGISLSSLAGAVAKAGGVGIISTAQIGFRDPDFYKNSQEANLKAMETELKKAREIAPDGILGFNIMVATKNYVEYVKTAVKIGADIIISGAGLPVNLPEYVKGTATKIAPIVSTVKSAKVICKLWDRNYKTAPDLVVVEGPLAGGHLGFSREQLTELGADTDQVSKTYHKAEYEEEVKGIIALVKAYGEKYGKEIPVVTAGGVYTHEDMRHCIEDLGADGVQVGTRFVTTEECDAPLVYKQAYINAKGGGYRNYQESGGDAGTGDYESIPEKDDGRGREGDQVFQMSGALRSGEYSLLHYTGPDQRGSGGRGPRPDLLRQQRLPG